MQSQNSDVINIIENRERRSAEVQQPDRTNNDWNANGGRDSQTGYSSSHMSYQFMPSNQQISFAHTNSGSKKTSEALVHTKSSVMSNFVPGTEHSAPEAIHIDF